MIDALREVAKEATHYEFGTWVGLINFAGVLVIAPPNIPLLIVDYAGYYFVMVLQECLRYRARTKWGRTYMPIHRITRPKPDAGSPVRAAATIAGLFVICVAVLAVVDGRSIVDQRQPGPGSSGSADFPMIPEPLVPTVPSLSP